MAAPRPALVDAEAEGGRPVNMDQARKATAAYVKRMQRLCRNPKSGLTAITITTPDGRGVRISAEGVQSIDPQSGEAKDA